MVAVADKVAFWAIIDKRLNQNNPNQQRPYKEIFTKKYFTGDSGLGTNKQAS